MSQMQLQPDDPIRPLDWRKAIPFEPAAWSDRLGWVGLKAARYYATPAFEFHPPALTHHMFILYARPPEQLDLVYEGGKRHVPPPAGAIMLMPAGSPSRVRFLPPLQASRRRHAGAVPVARKNRLTRTHRNRRGTCRPSIGSLACQAALRWGYLRHNESC
jgi:hypothetical protein